MFQYEWIMGGPLMIIVLIGLLAAIAIPLFNNVQARARIARAQTDVISVAAAVEKYRAHMGRLPGALPELSASATNARGVKAGPFIVALPQAPAGWSEGYRYEPRTDGTFVVSAVGDATTAKAP